MILNDNIPIETAYDTIVGKLKSYFANAGMQKAVVGLSGGIDSAVVMAIASAALGKDNIHGILMPSQFSTLHSVSDAVDLANNIGAEYEVIPIEKIYHKFMREMNSFFEIGEWSLAQENLQARIRGTILMTYSNKYNALLLNTSNKSELLTGYGTLYGDLCGAMMVIADLYKVQIYELARYINEVNNDVIPISTMQKAPSAELRPNQKDSDSLPVYDKMDPVLYAMFDEGRSREELIGRGVEAELIDKIVKLTGKSSFKVHQLPPVIKISNRPVVPENKWI
ncbi:MAG: NAD(+) synthase [Bacteroidales bacterium]|nr:NAD(+) synthase [Bacteroidales bacterium]MDD4669891.1 NAD(+) synthase [Bacteroidales bacterium]